MPGEACPPVTVSELQSNLLRDKSLPAQSDKWLLSLLPVLALACSHQPSAKYSKHSIIYRTTMNRHLSPLPQIFFCQMSNWRVCFLARPYLSVLYSQEQMLYKQPGLGNLTEQSLSVSRSNEMRGSTFQGLGLLFKPSPSSSGENKGVLFIQIQHMSKCQILRLLKKGYIFCLGWNPSFSPAWARCSYWDFLHHRTHFMS